MKNNQANQTNRIFVVGNEKGGAGKTTCSMHLITGLLYNGHTVASIDTDSRQGSLTNYLKNRDDYNLKNPGNPVKTPQHFHLTESQEQVVGAKEEDEKTRFEQIIEQTKNADYVVIDTPGSYSFLSRLAHSYADTVITPINDSFLDFDVLGKVNANNLSIITPSIYSQMVWEQKMQKANRNGETINWIVMRNRLSNLDAVNKRNVATSLEQLAKRISFKIAPGFSERVIFRELFLQGLTLLDLTTANHGKTLSISHVAARQELRDFLNFLEII
ncbi:division plane positioning ATPase MipZ [Candidatus Tisiphia endosymbiont of Dascillus cervinus]|uniref:division plane positioning ATPase MipZ n=1 Tax=Candidatus Tisiphia endosymbiont of Dascillus cervinus TaxID=3066253 RepID=UPI00312C9664